VLYMKKGWRGQKVSLQSLIEDKDTHDNRKGRQAEGRGRKYGR